MTNQESYIICMNHVGLSSPSSLLLTAFIIYAVLTNSLLVMSNYKARCTLGQPNFFFGETPETPGELRAKT